MPSVLKGVPFSQGVAQEMEESLAELLHLQAIFTTCMRPDIVGNSASRAIEFEDINKVQMQFVLGGM